MVVGLLERGWVARVAVLVLVTALLTPLLAPHPVRAAGDTPQVIRLAGETRVQTAVEVSAFAFPEGAPVALLARQDTYPDALAGAPLAAGEGGPILLTPPDRLHPDVRSELRRLAVDRVLLLGDRAALADGVADEVEALGVTVERLGGASRFDTARRIAQRATAGRDVDGVYVTRGSAASPSRGWADAVATGQVAAARRRPVVLTRQDALPHASNAALRDVRTPHAVLVGGEAALSDDVRRATAEVVPAVSRLAGRDRWQTSLAVAEHALQEGARADEVWLVTGRTFPDALTAGPVAGRRGAVLLLVDGPNWASAPARAWLRERLADVQRVVLVGGPTAIPEHVRADLEATGPRAPREPIDAEQTPLTRRVLAELGLFTDWLDRNDVRGFIGEVGWPSTHTTAGDWNDVAEAWYRAADEAELGVTAWAAGEWWPTEYPLTVYARDGVGHSQAGVIERHPATAAYARGVNVAGAEFAAPSTQPTSAFSNRNPGRYEVEYHYDGAETFRFLAGRGLRTVRLPFRWERLQPTLGQPLDEAEAGRLARAVRDARAAGLDVVLDMHNYGAYYLDDDGVGVRRPIGSPQVSVAHFADVWRRISERFRDDPRVRYGLMNEPVAMADSLTAGARRWEQASQAAVDTVRAGGDDSRVLVAGSHWSGVTSFRQLHPDAWIDDPLGNIRYEAHHYFDADRSGRYARSYDEELRLAASQESSTTTVAANAPALLSTPRSLMPR